LCRLHGSIPGIAHLRHRGLCGRYRRLLSSLKFILTKLWRRNAIYHRSSRIFLLCRVFFISAFTFRAAAAAAAAACGIIAARTAGDLLLGARVIVYGL
jgi:hypothetical protein